MRAEECLAVGKNNLFCDSDLELGARPCAPPAEGGERETVVAGSICVTWGGGTLFIALGCALGWTRKKRDMCL